MAEYRTCVKCGKSHELTPAHWHKSKDGFHARCRACRNKQVKADRLTKSQKKLVEIEKGAVDLFIAAARVGGTNIPHSSELLECMMKYFGGVEGFSRAFMKQFFDAPAGGAFRTKQLDSLLRLIVNNTAMGGAKKPLELMTEEELEAQYRRDVLAAAMAIKVNGKQARIESNGDMRELPVVDAGTAEVDSGIVHAVPAAGASERSDGGVPHDELTVGMRGVAPPVDEASE